MERGGEELAGCYFSPEKKIVSGIALPLIWRGDVPFSERWRRRRKFGNSGLFNSATGPVSNIIGAERTALSSRRTRGGALLAVEPYHLTFIGRAFD